jgi:hypothetical protein
MQRQQATTQSSAPSGGATTTAPRTTTTLVLRADHAEVRHIQWAEDVVDNEDMGKKSSKGMSQSPTISIHTTPFRFHFPSL